MKHTMEFQGGTVTMNMVPTRAILDIAEVARNVESDTQGMKEACPLLDKYLVSIEIDGHPDLTETESFMDCPAPWGLSALEQVFGFLFPGTQSAEE